MFTLAFFKLIVRKFVFSSLFFTAVEKKLYFNINEF